MTQALLNAIQGKKDSRYPVWFLRQAGRYLPEYRKLREGRSFLELCSDPRLAAEVTLQPIERFDLDAAIIFADILLLLMPLGQELSFKKDHGPLLTPPIRSKDDFKNLLNKKPKISDLAYVGETISIVRSKLPQNKSVIGFAGAPFTVASYMIEGGSSKNFYHSKRMLFSSPELFYDVMSLLTESTAEYLKMQSDAGCDLLMLFDSWAGALAPSEYEKHILPHIKKLKNFVKSLGKDLIYYPGANPENASIIEQTGKDACDVLHLDWRMDPKAFFSKKNLNPKISFQGNIDPLALFSHEATLRSKVRDLLDLFHEKAPYKHIFNVGHGLIPQTPIKSIETVIDEIRSYKRV